MYYILDHVMEPLTQKFIRKLRKILMAGTVDAYRQQVRSSEYRTVTSRPRVRALLPMNRINSSLTELIWNYECRLRSSDYLHCRLLANN